MRPSSDRFDAWAGFLIVVILAWLGTIIAEAFGC
jgi:hypothetical protein